MTMGTVTVRAQHELSAITATGNTTPHTVEFQNAETGLVTTGNVEVGKELTVAGNVAVDTDTLFVDSVNDRVGIGTTSPDNALHIRNAIPSVLLDDSDDDTKVRITGGAGGDLYVDSNWGGSGNTGDIIFREASSEKMRITGNGNVGIGTTSPGAKFTLYGDDTQDEGGLLMKVVDRVALPGGFTGIGLGGYATTSAPIIQVAKSAIIHERTGFNGTGNLMLCNDDTTDNNDVSNIHARMTITGAGRVGIGTTNPETTLQLHKELGADTLKSAAEIKFSTNNANNASWDVGSIRGAVTLNAGGSSNYPGGLVFATKSPGSAGGDLTDKMVIDANGNVGVGTASPETKLDIRGRVHQEDGRYTFDLENLRPHFIDTLSEFRYVAMMNDDAQYIIPNSGTILYEYIPSTDTTSVVITSTTNDNTVGTLTITAGREYYTNDMNPIVFVGGNNGFTSSSGNAYNGHHTIVPYIYNGFHFGLKNSRYEGAHFFIYAPYENVTVNVYINKGIQDTPDHTISITRQTVTQWIKVADGISANYNITFEAVGGRILMSKYGYAGALAGDHCILKPGSDLSYNFIDPYQEIYSHDLFGCVEYISDAYTFSSPSGVPVFNTSIGDGDGGNLVTQHPMELVGDVYYSPHNLEGFAILFMHPSQSITVEYLTASNGSWQQYEVIASPSKKASIHYPVYISRGTVATSITQEPDKTPDNVDFTATEKAYVAWKFTSNRGTFLLRFESADAPNGSPFEDEYTPFGWLDSSKTYKIHKTIRPTTPFFLKTYLDTGIDLNDPLQADGVTAATQGSWYYRNVVGPSFNQTINPMHDKTNDYFNSVVNPDANNTRDIEVPVPGLWRISIHVNMIVSALGRDGNAYSALRNSIGVRPVVSGSGLPENASMGYIRNSESHVQSSVYISTIDMINTERRTVNVQFNRITDDTNNIITVASGSFILLEKL